MKVENDKVHDVLCVLALMRNDFDKRKSPKDVSHLRLNAVESFAESELLAGRYQDRRSARNTVHSALVPRLRPDVMDIGQFDDLAARWLRDNSMKLKGVLLKYTDDPIRRDEVIAFFGERQGTESAKRTSLVTQDSSIEPRWLPPEAAGPTYIPKDGDFRKIVERQIRERRGQQLFRDGLRKRYQDRCLITKCRILDVLEAAHIRPYRGENDNALDNGLLLRADIHSLFDLDLIGIEPYGLFVHIHHDLYTDSTYAKLAGKPLHWPSRHRPSQNALKLRYDQFQERRKQR